MTVGIVEGKDRGLVADLQGALGQAAGDQFVGGAFHHRMDLWRCVVRWLAADEVGFEGIEFGLQCHGRFLMSTSEGSFNHPVMLTGRPRAR